MSSIRKPSISGRGAAGGRPTQRTTASPPSIKMPMRHPAISSATERGTNVPCQPFLFTAYNHYVICGVFNARRYASAVFAVVVCPSICLSVCLSICHKQGSFPVRKRTGTLRIWRAREREPIWGSGGGAPSGVQGQSPWSEG